MQTSVIKLAIVALASAILSPVTLAQDATSGSEILNGSQGHTKGRECRAHIREMSTRELADVCMRTCIPLEGKIRAGQAVPQEQIDQCNASYSKFRVAHEQRTTADGDDTLPDIVGALRDFNSDTGRVSVASLVSRDWGSLCRGMAIVKTRNSLQVLQQKGAGRSSVKLVGVRLPAPDETGRRVGNCTADRIELVSSARR